MPIRAAANSSTDIIEKDIKHEEAKVLTAEFQITDEEKSHSSSSHQSPSNNNDSFTRAKENRQKYLRTNNNDNDSVSLSSNSSKNKKNTDGKPKIPLSLKNDDVLLQKKKRKIRLYFGIVTTGIVFGFLSWIVITTSKKKVTTTTTTTTTSSPDGLSNDLPSICKDPYNNQYEELCNELCQVSKCCYLNTCRVGNEMKCHTYMLFCHDFWIDRSWLDYDDDFSYLDETILPPKLNPIVDLCEKEEGKKEICKEMCLMSSCCWNFQEEGDESQLSCHNETVCEYYQNICIDQQTNTSRYLNITNNSPMKPLHKDLRQVCSLQSISSSSFNYNTCITACQFGLCCFDSSCSNQTDTEICESYQESCQRISSSYNLWNNKVIPQMTPTELVCSKDFEDKYGSEFCLKTCELGSCCYAQDDSNCRRDFFNACAQYQTCQHRNDTLYNSIQIIPLAPANIKETCSKENISISIIYEEICEIACNPGKCCWNFEQKEDSCLEENLEVCDSYSSCQLLLE